MHDVCCCYEHTLILCISQMQKRGQVESKISCLTRCSIAQAMSDTHQCCNVYYIMQAFNNFVGYFLNFFETAVY